MEQLFSACGADTPKFGVYSLSVRIKCEYPQKLSTDVDKPVDNMRFAGYAHGSSRKLTEGKT
jgi:hypothetical protein